MPGVLESFTRTGARAEKTQILTVVDSSTRERLDALAERIGERTGGNVSRSAIMREAVHRYLDEAEQEIDNLSDPDEDADEANETDEAETPSKDKGKGKGRKSSKSKS